MGLPWYPRYIGDYAEKTQDLSMLEHGAYSMLLDFYYANGPIAVDKSVKSGDKSSAKADMFADHLPTRLLTICRAISRPEQEAVATVVSRFFTLLDGRFHNKRADEELAKRSKISPLRSEAGKIGAAKTNEKRWGKGRHKASSSDDNLPTVLPSTPTPTPTSITPYPLKGGGVFQDGGEGRGGAVFKVENMLTEDGWQAARGAAPGWDIKQLAMIYDAGIMRGERERPKFANKAFPIWCGLYTKGKRP